MLKFPYGLRTFKTIIDEGYLYIDRTHHIRMIEEWGRELLFLRPRRFGKSLWLSIMMDYYDVAKADDFERLFGHLAIGQDPTPLHNQYLVMRWDLSKIRSHGTVEQIEADLNVRVNGFIRRFVGKYEDRLALPVEINPEYALDSVESLIASIDVSDDKLYLFIDEYDNFANEVMMSVQNGTVSPKQGDRYHDLVSGEGLFKTFFKNLKGFGAGEGLDRVFITGVSPIVMNDVSSGANVFDDIYWFQEFNDLCGFYEDEVAEMLTGVLDELKARPNQPTIDPEETLNLMRTYYDGSWFTTESYELSAVSRQPLAVSPKPLAPNYQPSTRLYNPTMVFHFLRYLQRTGRYPDQMLDRNLRADRGKLQYIANYSQGRSLLVETLNAQQDITVYELGKDFGAKELLRPDMGYGRLASLLCYLGALTIAGRGLDRQIKLAIPNLVMQKMYAERIQEMAITEMKTLHELELAADVLCQEGELKPLCDLIEANIMSIYSNRDYPEFKELALKSIFISMLYHHPLYILRSEPELHRRYGDLLLLVRPDAYNSGLWNLLFEFKQIPLNKVVEKENIETADEEQPAKKGKKKGEPLTDEEVRERSREALLKIPAVKEAMDEAKKQLGSYRKTLYGLYSEEMKLVSYAVVGVGLGRIVFELVDS